MLLVALTLSAPACAERSPDEALQRALAFFERVDTIDHSWSPLLAYLHRRFGVVVTNAQGRTVHDAVTDVERPELFAVYQRLVDPRARVDVQQIADLPTAIDRISASALHCDRIALPPDWIEILGKASRLGAYALTHAVVAGQWTLENGCLEPLALASLQTNQVDLLEDLIAHRRQLDETSRLSTDIWMEAVALLYYVGASSRVHPEWIREIVTLQQPDGGWRAGPRLRDSDPHATALAIWVLLEHLRDDGRDVPWVPRVTQGAKPAPR